ncbi:hypothetical protein AB1I63_00265 [Streptococcus pneumoniae]
MTRKSEWSAIEKQLGKMSLGKKEKITKEKKRQKVQLKMGIALLSVIAVGTIYMMSHETQLSSEPETEFDYFKTVDFYEEDQFPFTLENLETLKLSDGQTKGMTKQEFISQFGQPVKEDRVEDSSISLTYLTNIYTQNFRSVSATFQKRDDKYYLVGVTATNVRSSQFPVDLSKESLSEELLKTRREAVDSFVLGDRGTSYPEIVEKIGTPERVFISFSKWSGLETRLEVEIGYRVYTERLEQELVSLKLLRQKDGVCRLASKKYSKEIR